MAITEHILGEHMMTQQHHITSSWGVGLTEAQAAMLRDTLGEQHHIAAHADWQSALAEPHPPFMLWLSVQGLRELAFLPAPILHELEEAPKALLLDPDYTLADFETACDLGVSEIVRTPLSRERLADIMRRVLEVRSISLDLECMSREISVERELLERKNNILSFLVSFLTHTSESMDVEDLLQAARKDMTALMPVTAVHAALWDREGDSCETTLYIAAPEESPERRDWEKTLLTHAFRHSCPRRAELKTVTLRRTGEPEPAGCPLPDEDNLLCLPLVCGQERLGILLVQTATSRYLGRDQALALDSALRHFSLTIKNARRFRQLQMHADYDALTRVHSRRHFEQRIVEETQRFARYGEPLSMIMLDIDHFKAVNDTHGHHVGDQVLREVAAELAASIRNTDYCARYGGEEFAVLLPHTNGKRAHALAERIRKRIAKRGMESADGTPLQVTVSLGVASLGRDSKADASALLCKADAALYAAKSKGRNRTFSFVQSLPTPPASEAACLHCAGSA